MALLDIRLWTLRFGTEYARRLRCTRGACSNIWHLDELCLMINGERGWLWRAVDDVGEVLDILVQRRRSARAAKPSYRGIMLTGGGGLQTMPVEPELQREFDAAKRLFDGKKYAEAEPLLTP